MNDNDQCEFFIFRQAWKQLGDMEPQQAMQEYISCVNVLDPEGSRRVILAITNQMIVNQNSCFLFQFSI